MKLSRTQEIDENVTNISEDNVDVEKEIKKSPTDKKLKVKKKIKKSKSEPTKGVVKELEDEIEEELKLTNKPSLFQRLFSQDDELSLLQIIFDFTSTRGKNPLADKDGFFDYVKPLLTFDASRTQVTRKIQNLKRKFGNTLKKSLKKGFAGEKYVILSNNTNQKNFDLSRKIWGVDGVWTSKAKKNLGENSKKEVEESQLPISYGKEITSFVKAENASSLGLDENAMIQYWDNIEDDPKKKEMVVRFKKLKRMEHDLCYKRIEVVKSTANMMLKENKRSSSSK